MKLNSEGSTQTSRVTAGNGGEESVPMSPRCQEKTVDSNANARLPLTEDKEAVVPDVGEKESPTDID